MFLFLKAAARVGFGDTAVVDESGHTIVRFALQSHFTLFGNASEMSLAVASIHPPIFHALLPVLFMHGTGCFVNQA